MARQQPRYRHALPQLNGGLYLSDGGLETDLIFNHGIPIKGFASHTLLPGESTRLAMTNYYRGFLSLAQVMDTGFILDGQTWKAHAHWADDLDESIDELRLANQTSVAYIAALRDEYAANRQPIVLNCSLGPPGDAYAPDYQISAREAEDYHRLQLSWLAETQVDMVTAMTFTQAEEAIGIVRAAKAEELPIVVSFTLETNGLLPTGQSLRDAIEQVDIDTNNGPIYFMVNCAHPDHFPERLRPEKLRQNKRPEDSLREHDWCKRIKGIRCNASRLSHAELDSCSVLDAGDPDELGKQYREIYARMPWLNIFGGCCGSDLRHVTEIARAVML